MKPLFTFAAAAMLLLGGCSAIGKRVDEEISQNLKAQKQTLDTPLRVAPVSRVGEARGFLTPVTQVTVKKGDWLRQHRVQLEIRNPTPLSAVVAKLAEQGINITSDLPLDGYSYVGKINPTDAETALKAILGSVGLDYRADDDRKLVLIKPMSSRSWFLNIGHRKSSYSSAGQAGGAATTGAAPDSGQSGSSATSAPGASESASAGAGGASAGSGSAGGMAQTTAFSSSSTAGVSSSDDFWSSLAKELSNRLTILTPQPNSRGGGTEVGLPGLPPPPGGMAAPPPPLPSPSAAAPERAKKQIGSYSMNPETGAVTVQAPHWILDDLDSYFKRVQEMYNTDISFVGELVLVTSNQVNSEGLDISAFARWASGKYGAVVSNNALGGITVSLPGAGSPPSVAAGAQTVAGPLVGLVYSGANNALDIFNAYLAEIGKVSVIQRPLITTTSGVPGVFSKKYFDYYNTVSQQAAAGGTGSAATATQNVLVPVELGMDLRINPRIDVATGLIRAQLTLDHAIKSGVKTVPQTITFGNASATVNTTIPLVTKQNISGEILLRDGDLIVVGGQTENNLSLDENGLPGEDGPTGGILGVKKATRGAQTYYFALRVVVNKRQ